MTADEKREAAATPGLIRNPGTGKIIAKRFTLQQLEEADEAMAGYCRACGAWRDTCEPDARNYPCDDSEMAQVFGAGELAIMGAIL